MNREGLTFLDIAILKHHKHVCLAAIQHDRWLEILCAPTKAFPAEIYGLIESMPEMCSVLSIYMFIPSRQIGELQWEDIYLPPSFLYKQIKYKLKQMKVLIQHKCSEFRSLRYIIRSKRGTKFFKL